MEGDAGAGLAGYVIGTLPQRLEEVDDVFGGSFHLLESESGCEFVLLCEGMEDPLDREISVLMDLE